MPCTPIKIGDGTAIVCTRGPRKTLRCSCGRTTARICDWPVPERKSGTCDKPVCEYCRRRGTGEKDYCPFHRGSPPMTQAELDLAGKQAAEDAARILGLADAK